MFARVLRYALLGLVDAFVPAVVAASLVYGVALYGPGPVAYLVPAGVAAVVLAVGFVVGAVSASRGGTPFPVTRAALRVFRRLYWV